MAKRKSTGKRQRFEIFKRDRFKCVYCGRSPPDVLLQVDHVLAVANGGTNDATNLVTACADCNGGKSSIVLTSVAPSLEQQAKETRERAEQIKAFAQMVTEARQSDDETVQLISDAWFAPINPRPGEWSYRLSGDRVASIKRFLGLLPVNQILQAVEFAHAARWKRGLGVSADERGTLQDARLFRYFCGIVWNMVRAREAQP